MRGIVLKGASNTGKTQTLKCLIRLLMSDPNFKLFDCCKDFDRKIGDSVSDVWAMFCFHGVHIVITTMGDSPSDTDTFIKNHSLGVDIFICACHDTPWAQEKISKSFNKLNGDCVFIDKNVYKDKNDQKACEKLNESEAKELLETLKKHLEEILRH